MEKLSGLLLSVVLPVGVAVAVFSLVIKHGSKRRTLIIKDYESYEDRFKRVEAENEHLGDI